MYNLAAEGFNAVVKRKVSKLHCGTCIKDQGGALNGFGVLQYLKERRKCEIARGRNGEIGFTGRERNPVTCHFDTVKAPQILQLSD